MRISNLLIPFSHRPILNPSLRQFLELLSVISQLSESKSARVSREMPQTLIPGGTKSGVRSRELQQKWASTQISAATWCPFLNNAVHLSWAERALQSVRIQRDLPRFVVLISCFHFHGFPVAYSERG